MEHWARMTLESDRAHLVQDTDRERLRNQLRASAPASSIRSSVIKRLWGVAKVRYPGLYKNAVRVHALLALANLYLARRRLLAQGLVRAKHAQHGC